MSGPAERPAPVTAEDHLGRAVDLLRTLGVVRGNWQTPETIGLVLEAIGHALAAIAIEIGVPPVQPTEAGEDSGAIPG